MAAETLDRVRELDELVAPPTGAKRCFFLNFNQFSLSRQSVLDFLDTQPDVMNWLVSNALLGQVIVVSERSCIEIAALSVAKTRSAARFGVPSGEVTMLHARRAR
jgi:hypothetical protein